jgi:endopeptidase Clp ATP-binding regulatory subunit ClpX
MKVSIPREEIERIVRQFGCTEAQAAKAYLDAQSESKSAFEEELVRQLGEKKEIDEWQMPILSPRQIKAHLDRYVIGQEEYKKRLSIAAAFHFAILRFLEKQEEEIGVKRFRKKNTLIAGPSGSGKTYCAEILGDLLELPTLIVDATDYTEAGYVGKSAEDMVRELIDMAPGVTRPEKAEFINRYGGIIFIDEIDKKAKDGKLIGHDISREGFQRAVLKLVERKYVSIDSPHSPASQFQEVLDRQRRVPPRKQKNMISTEKILFIVGGSFQRPGEDLEKIVKERLRHQDNRTREDGSFVVAGFGEGSEEERTKVIKNYYKAADADDFIRYGLIPELVGRIPIRSHVNLLSKNDLVRIMRDTEDSIINQYRAEFKAFGIDLAISDSAIEYIAGMAENRKTGARALVSVCETIFTDFQYELPGSNFKKLEVDRDLCQAPKDALLKMLKRSPFVDFSEGFKKEYGIQLVFDKEAEAYVEEHARQHNIQVSEALKRLLNKISSLNYMDIKEDYRITREMLADKSFFDTLFTRWHKEGRPGPKRDQEESEDDSAPPI